jgi:hypothetical protein
MSPSCARQCVLYPLHEWLRLPIYKPNNSSRNQSRSLIFISVDRIAAGKSKGTPPPVATMRSCVSNARSESSEGPTHGILLPLMQVQPKDPFGHSQTLLYILRADLHRSLSVLLEQPLRITLRAFFPKGNPVSPHHLEHFDGAQMPVLGKLPGQNHLHLGLRGEFFLHGSKRPFSSDCTQHRLTLCACVWRSTHWPWRACSFLAESPGIRLGSPRLLGHALARFTRRARVGPEPKARGQSNHWNDR